MIDRLLNEAFLLRRMLHEAFCTHAELGKSQGGKRQHLLRILCRPIISLGVHAT